MTHAPTFHVVLHQPEIPNNTGNIGRTCVATGAALHLIHPLAFDTSVKALRRAGLDYWPRLAPTEHDSWGAYTRAWPDARRWVLTTHAKRPVWDADLRRGDHLIFGSETRGLPETIRDADPAARLALPMIPEERSLNLATGVCATLYEGLRQLVARDEVRITPDGRLGTRIDQT